MKFFEWLKTSWWKIVVGIGTFVSLTVGFSNLDSRYASCKDVLRLEQKTIEALEDFRKEQNRVFLLQRYESLNDTYYKYKTLIKAYPSDLELKEDLSRIERERTIVKEAISSTK